MHTFKRVVFRKFPNVAAAYVRGDFVVIAACAAGAVLGLSLGVIWCKVC
jgi:hypothetical protein